MGKRGSRQLLAILAIALAAPACGGGGGGGKKVPKTFTVNVVSSTTSEDGVTTATFTVVLPKRPRRDVTLPVSTSNNLEGVPDKASLTFTKLTWNVPQTVTVTGIDDFLDDGDAGYSIILGTSVSADKQWNGINPPDVALTNTDNDTAGFNFQNILGLTTTEGAGTAQFTVQLNSQPTSDVTLTLSTDNANEGTVSPTTLTFTVAAGADAWNQPHTVTITGVDDLVPTQDGPVLYHVTFGAASGGGPGYDTVTPSNIDVTNNDNDQAGITANPSAGLVTNESGTTDSFTVVLNSQPQLGTTVTIDVTSSNANAGLVSTAGSAIPGVTKTLTFTDADWNTPQTVTVHGVDDALPTDNAPVVYNVTLNPASVGDANYNALADLVISATNGDDDTPGITVTLINPPLVTTEAAGTATFTVQLDTVPSSPVVLTVVSNNTLEGTVDLPTLTFLADATALNPQTVTLTGVQDGIADGNVAYTVTVAVDGTTTDPGYTGLSSIIVNATNNDDDLPGINVSKSSGLVTDESGLTDTFTVALTSVPVSSVTINFTVTQNPGEVTVTTLLTFAADATALNPQTVTVTGQDDGNNLDGNIPFTVTGTPTSADPNYGAALAFTVTGTNNDNDALDPGAGPWTKDPTPAIPVGTAGAWDDRSSQEPTVIKLNATDYVMWYEGANLTGQKHEQVGRAVSTNGGVTWIKDTNPVLTHTGINGTFDKNGAGDPSVYFDGATYHMWYAGRENAGHKNKIGYATSSDGISWTRQNGGNPVLVGTGGTFDAVGVYGPMVIFDGVSTYHMWYTGNDGTVTRIGHATSANGITWSKTVGAVLNTGATGAFDAAGVKLCAVVQDGATYRMWYVGVDTVPQQKIGFATAAVADLGLNWTKNAGNPVMTVGAAGSFDERNLWGPWVLLDNGDFRMWYGGENNAGTIRILYATAP